MRKYFSNFRPQTFPISNLVSIQTDSYNWFLKYGLRELFREISPIQDATGKILELNFLDYYFDEPKYAEMKAKEHNASFEATLRCKLSLVFKKTGEIKKQEVYLGDFPLMTDRGTFLVNGIERVVVSQLIRSPGVFFTAHSYKRRQFFGAKVIPNRGAWLEFETDPSGVIYVRIDRKRKVPATSLLRIFGAETNEEIMNTFKDIDNDPNIYYIKTTLEKDIAKNKAESFTEIYRRIRPGDLATADNAQQLIESMFFNFSRYDLSVVGRYKINQRLNFNKDSKDKSRLLGKEDVIGILREIIKLNNSQTAKVDDIDHLGNRRVRPFGELLQNKLRIGLARMERIIKDRMSTFDTTALTAAQLINIRPFTAAIKEFFTSSQLSQFMDQVNPLAELEHKRRLSTMGPGGLARERAGFEVRDVHPSFYGRICPIQTPEGQNIGLINHLACYAKVNQYGFIETPYRKVNKGKITDEIVYLDALEEEKYNIAEASVLYDKNHRFITPKVAARVKGEPGTVDKNNVDFIDVAPNQSFSVATSLIPFLEHDDANRALMGSNMQRQAVSCVKPQAPLIGTGMEKKAAVDSGQVVVAKEDGIIKEMDASHIVIESQSSSGKNTFHRYHLSNFMRSNQFTCIHHRPRARALDRVKKGDVIADGASTDNGELALGQNILAAFMPWAGANFEDAIIISEKLVQDDRYSSIHIENYVCNIRDTKLGPEITTPDIPNVGEEKLRDLDEDGIVRIGAEVNPLSILVGKISPKGEVDLTSEERLLRAIFGEKARDVKDASLTLPHGKHGRVVGIRILARDQGDKLPSGVIKSIQIDVAQLRKIAAGDKLAGRHGNKGVISKILPVEDMPHLEDGTPVDIILNPLGVASRMNIGQILETHLGLAAITLNYKALSPTLNGVPEEEIKEELKRAGFNESGKMKIYDGRTGESFDQLVTVGYIYMMKLHHLVEDKIHMRSIGPYSLITQQPLGGKAQFGGQRFGEMEVWALEGYGAAHTLQEMITIKSDDVVGRSAAYDAIIRGKPIRNPNIPASFYVLLNELKGLGLDVEVIEAREDKYRDNDQ